MNEPMIHKTTTSQSTVIHRGSGCLAIDSSRQHKDYTAVQVASGLTVVNSDFTN